MSADAMRHGAATALLDVLRARRPDLAWEVLVPERNQRQPSPPGPGGVAGGDHTDAAFAGPGALGDEHDRKRAA